MVSYTSSLYDGARPELMLAWAELWTEWIQDRKSHLEHNGDMSKHIELLELFKRANDDHLCMFISGRTGLRKEAHRADMIPRSHSAVTQLCSIRHRTILHSIWTFSASSCG